MNRRLIYFTIIGLVVLLGIGGALFYFSKKQQQQTAATPGPLKIIKVLDEQVISPIPAYNNSSIWYFNSSGRLFKAKIDGSDLSEFPLPSLPGNNLKSALWPNDGSDFIAISGFSPNVVKNYFDSTNKIFISFADNVLWLDWMPDGKRVVYIWQATDKKSQQLVMADADGTGFIPIADVFWPDLAVKASPNGKMVLMYRTNISGDTNKIYIANMETGQILTLVDQGNNTDAKWLASGNFLFAQASKVYFYDLLNKQAIDLNLNTSLDKIAADSQAKYLYAATPNPQNSGDTFIKIDLTTLKSESYFEPDSQLKVKNLFLVGNTVYYIDSRDNKLYMISN